MSVLNSQRSAANSLSAPERSMSVGSMTVAPSASSAAIVSARIGSTIARGGRSAEGAGAPDPDPGAVEGLVVQELRVVREGVPDLAGGGRVVRIDAGQRAEEDRSVRHVASHRAGGVLVGADRDDARTAPEPECRLDADDAVRAGRADDRAVGLGADRDRLRGPRLPPRPSPSSSRRGCGRGRRACSSGRRCRSNRTRTGQIGNSPTRSGWPCPGRSPRRPAAARR